jgi:hypothetical protein
LYPHRAEHWAELRRVGRWRFIVADGVRAAIATGFGFIVFGLATVVYYASRDGQALDFHWFVIPGLPGAPTFPVYRHALALLPVSFVFSLVFWLFAGAKCWWLNESVHRESMTLHTKSARPEVGAAASQPLARVSMLGELAFLVFFMYLPLIAAWPNLRLAQAGEEALWTAGFAGAGVVWGIGFVSWLVRLARNVLAFVPGLFGRESSAGPMMPLFADSRLGPAEPEGFENASPSLKYYRTCFYMGSTLLLCGFIFSSPLGPFLPAPILDWSVYIGVAFLLVGVGFAAYGSYSASRRTS